jgi:hypothetical protein
MIGILTTALIRVKAAALSLLLVLKSSGQVTEAAIQNPGVNSLLWLATSLVIAAAIVACAFRYSPVVLTYQTINSFYSFDHRKSIFPFTFIRCE